MEGIRKQDKVVFHEVAARRKIWILVRETNPFSLKYVGDLNYYPKPIDCKPKTAQMNVLRKDGKGVYDLRGLVVDPTIHREAFAPEKQAKVVNIWQSFASHYNLKSQQDRYTVDFNEKSNHYGCLKVRERGLYKCLHGDYDLKDIVESGAENWNLALPWTEKEQPHSVILLLHNDLEDIQKEINRRIGVPMVQHSSEAQFAGHSDEPINVFTPQGQEIVLADQAAVECYYLRTFKGRQTVKVGAGPMERIPAARDARKA